MPIKTLEISNADRIIIGENGVTWAYKEDDCIGTAYFDDYAAAMNWVGDTRNKAYTSLVGKNISFRTGEFFGPDEVQAMYNAQADEELRPYNSLGGWSCKIKRVGNKALITVDDDVTYYSVAGIDVWNAFERKFEKHGFDSINVVYSLAKLIRETPLAFYIVKRGKLVLANTPNTNL